MTYSHLPDFRNNNNILFVFYIKKNKFRFIIITHLIFLNVFVHSLNFLNKKMLCPLSSRHRNEDWQPLELYKNSLLHGDSETVPAGTNKKNYGRKKKDMEEEHEDLEMDNLSLDDNDFP